MQDLSALLAQLGYDPALIEKIVVWSVYLTVASVVAAIPTGILASRKGRSVGGWVVFALCLPVLPLFIILGLPAKKNT